jgi:hypothetical protein
MKSIRRIFALVALIAVAIKGILSFLSWFEKQEEVSTVWTDDEEFEDAI